MRPKKYEELQAHLECLHTLRQSLLELAALLLQHAA